MLLHEQATKTDQHQMNYTVTTRSRYCYFLKVTCYVTLLHCGKCKIVTVTTTSKVTCYCNGVTCNKLLPITVCCQCLFDLSAAFDTIDHDKSFHSSILVVWYQWSLLTAGFVTIFRLDLVLSNVLVLSLHPSLHL